MFHVLGFNYFLVCFCHRLCFKCQQGNVLPPLLHFHHLTVTCLMVRYYNRAYKLLLRVLLLSFASAISMSTITTTWAYLAHQLVSCVRPSHRQTSPASPDFSIRWLEFA